MTDKEILDWIEKHEGKYSKGPHCVYLDWYDDDIGRFTVGESLRDCVLKAMEKENES